MKITRTRKLLGVAPIVFAAIGTTSLADDSALCSEHPRCLATPQLPFEYCCPNSGGVFSQCCDTAKEKKARCNAHSSCEERGLTGFCCPTVEGEYLGCCDEKIEISKHCSANNACSGLVGECCPTKDGVMLDCCYGYGKSRECSANPLCAALGLEGACCPTGKGQYLDCCSHNKPAVAPKAGQLCSSHPDCSFLGLKGSCCPSEFGQMLHCCDDESNNIFDHDSGTPSVSPTVLARKENLPTSLPSANALSAVEQSNTTNATETKEPGDTLTLSEPRDQVASQLIQGTSSGMTLSYFCTPGIVLLAVFATLH